MVKFRVLTGYNDMNTPCVNDDTFPAINCVTIPAHHYVGQTAYFDRAAINTALSAPGGPAISTKFVSVVYDGVQNHPCGFSSIYKLKAKDCTIN